MLSYSLASTSMASLQSQDWLPSVSDTVAEYSRYTQRDDSNPHARIVPVDEGEEMEENEDEGEEDGSHRSGRPARGRRTFRDSSIKITRLSSAPHSTLPAEQRHRQSQSIHHHQHASSSSPDKSSHHHLPQPTEADPFDPILYLPPLLSPLPTSVASHDHHGRTEEELSSFATRLPDIDPASLELHQALHHFRPVEGYAARGYDGAFNWGDLHLPAHTSREWYCVVFRSRRKPSSSSLSLYQADREAHEEAVMNGGLVMYWYGVPDGTGLNLATCIWQSRRHAIKAISGPKHLAAMKHAKDAYEMYDLERWVLSTEEGEDGVSLRRWEGGEVGW